MTDKKYNKLSHFKTLLYLKKQQNKDLAFNRSGNSNPVPFVYYFFVLEDYFCAFTENLKLIYVQKKQQRS